VLGFVVVFVLDFSRGGLTFFFYISISNNDYCDTQDMSRRSSKPETQRAALAMLARGWSPCQVARVAGVSRQLIEQWARSARVDWRRICHTRLVDQWYSELKRKPDELPSKRKLRQIADRAKAKWDKANGSEKAKDLDNGSLPEVSPLGSDWDSS
jgi:transcriptional regulator with XRE-family HTH domain